MSCFISKRKTRLRRSVYHEIRGNVENLTPTQAKYCLLRAGRVTEFGDIGQRFQPKEHLVLVLG